MNKYLNSLSREERRDGSFYALDMLHQESILKLNFNKPVATPDYNTSKFVNNWLAFSDELQEYVKYRFLYFMKEKYHKNINLGVYIHPNLRLSEGNRIIFYSENHLLKLSILSNKSINELLELFSVICPYSEKYKMDIIRIAFNDDPKYSPLETEEGKIIYDKFIPKENIFLII